MRSEIFRARTILTMTGEPAEAFAVIGDRVAAVGNVADLRARFADADVTDFGAATIVPGFNDAHTHLAMAAEDMLHLDLSIDAVRSLAEIAAALRAQRDVTPRGEWIRGTRYDDAKMAEGRVLTRWDLDDVSREHPIMILQVAGHWGVVNSKALERGGIDETTPPPEGGKFGYDASGRLNGMLFEQAIFDFAYPQAARRPQTVAPASTPQERRRGLRLGMTAFNAAGITSLTDALIGPADIALMQDAERANELTLRINMLVHYGHYEAIARLGLRTDTGGDFVRLGGIKAFVDGAIGGRTCLMEQPFEGSSDDFGIQTTSDADLRDIVRMVHGDGNRVCVHANGDRAIAKLLDALEGAQREQPRPELNHRIEHCSIVNAEILTRMKAVGAIAQPFGSYVYYHGGKLLDWYGPARLERMFAHRSFLDYGIGVAGSSDYPCGPFEPLLGMQSCVTRTGWDGTPLGLKQRITALEALALYTVNAAAASGEAHIKGRLAPGYLADFVVLEENPLAVDPSTLGAISIRATYVGAQPVWQRTG